MSQFVVRTVVGPADLAARTPLTATTITCLPDFHGRGEYWCASLDAPVKYHLPDDFNRRRCQPEFLGVDEDGEFVWTGVVVVWTDDPNRRLERGMRDVDVHIGYVVDQTLGRDRFLDWGKVDVVATGRIDDADPAPPVVDVAAVPPIAVDPPTPPVEVDPPVPPALVEPPEPAVAADTPPPPVATDPSPPVDQPTPPVAADPRPARVASPPPVPPVANPPGPLRPPRRAEANVNRPPAEEATPQLGPAQFRDRLALLLAKLASLTSIHPGEDEPIEAAMGDLTADGYCGFELYGPDGPRYRRRDLAVGWQTIATGTLEELLYRIVDDVARDVAWRWSASAPIATAGMPDHLRVHVATSYWRLLVEALDPEWGERTSASIDRDGENRLGT